MLRIGYKDFLCTVLSEVLRLGTDVESVLSLRMAKLSFEKTVQKVDHRWRSPLGQKEDMTRPVIEGRAGEPFYHFPNPILVPSASSSASSQHPVTPKLAPLPLKPDVDLMNFD
jgi:hypothetical protein